MCEFFGSYELWSNIIGGVVSAIIITGLIYLWNYRKRKIVNELKTIMGGVPQGRLAGQTWNPAPGRCRIPDYLYRRSPLPLSSISPYALCVF